MEKKKNEMPYNMATALDCAIRDNERKKGGYKMTKSDTTYCNYMNNTEWNDFLTNMNPIHRAQYSCGGGGRTIPREISTQDGFIWFIKSFHI